MIKKHFKTLLYLVVFVFLAQFAYAYNVVKLSPEYFPLTSKGKPVSSAYIYVGKPDLDPTVVANQKTLSVQQEDGTIVAITQPIRTGAGGVPLYLGSPVTLLVDGDYSLTVLSSSEVQIYYVPSVLYYTPLTTPYARYFPDYTEVDQGVVGGGNSVYDILTEVGVVTGATMYFAHNSGAATTTYTFTTNEAITDNFDIVIEKGVILDGAGTLTLDSPSQLIVQPDQLIFGPTITVVLTNPGIVYPEWKGALGNAATDDSVAIQAMIDALETAKGGTVQFLSKTYVCNIEAKSYVELKGAVPMFKGSSAGTTSHNNTYLKANATGHIITTAAGALYGITVRNIGFIGLGAAVPLKGIYLQNVGRSLFEDLAFDNIADEAIRINDGNPNHFRRIFAQNCLLDRSQAAKIGVLHIEHGADDQWVSDSEFTASSTSLSDANAYICAVLVDASNCFLVNVIGEISDVGIYIGTNGLRNRLTSCRADLNYSHGFEIYSAGGNQFINCFALSNGHETDNTYDGFHSESSGNNNFVGCFAESYATDAEKHRYGFYDDVNSVTLRSRYSGCRSLLHQTASYYGNPFYGIGPTLTDENIMTVTADDATPSVNGYKFFTLSNATGALDVTDFNDGTPGQLIYVVDLSATGRVTIKYNAAKIVTLAGADILMLKWRIYAFKQYNGVWYEIGSQQFATDVTVAGAGTDGTISSRSANPLSEANGFVKMYNNAGTLVYVPYWLNIIP